MYLIILVFCIVYHYYFAVHHCFCFVRLLLLFFSFSLVHFQFMMSFKDFLIKILYLVSCILLGLLEFAIMLRTSIHEINV